MEKQIQLIPRNLSFPIARFLNENEQKLYEEAVKGYNTERARTNLNVTSNLFKILLLNQIRIRTATLPELEQIIQINEDFLEGTYEDVPPVVLRSKGDSYKDNDYLARSLAKDLKIRGEIKTPLIVTGLINMEDVDSAYGLSLKPTDKTEIIKAPDFSHKNNGKKFKTINPDYTINFDAQGNRTFYSREDGLSGVYLDSCLSLCSGIRSLADSNDIGRVVVVDAEGVTSKNLESYIS